MALLITQLMYNHQEVESGGDGEGNSGDERDACDTSVHDEGRFSTPPRKKSRPDESLLDSPTMFLAATAM